jgi:rare lipoprotein A
MKLRFQKVTKIVTFSLVLFVSVNKIKVPTCTPGPVQQWVQVQKGMASWYGEQLHGRLTASGAAFNTHDLTAAHRTLPFGTRVRVVNRWNGKSVIVRITDRGPFVDGRVIDLSHRAARVIGAAGITPVLLQLEAKHGKH